jgi:hypothetical protein
MNGGDGLGGQSGIEELDDDGNPLNGDLPPLVNEDGTSYCSDAVCVLEFSMCPAYRLCVGSESKNAATMDDAEKMIDQMKREDLVGFLEQVGCTPPPSPSATAAATNSFLGALPFYLV